MCSKKEKCKNCSCQAEYEAVVKRTEHLCGPADPDIFKKAEADEKEYQALKAKYPELDQALEQVAQKILPKEKK